MSWPPTSPAATPRPGRWASTDDCAGQPWLREWEPLWAPVSLRPDPESALRKSGEQFSYVHPVLPFSWGWPKRKKKKTGKAMRAYSPQEEWTRPLLLVLTLFHFHFNLKIGTPLFFSPWLSLDIQIPFCKLKTTKGKLY